MRFGFIGCGNMGGAIAKAVCAQVSGENVILANKTRKKAEILAQELQCAVGTNEEAARCDFVFLGVKPHLMEGVLTELRPVLLNNQNAVLVTMAAGLTTARIREMAGTGNPVIRMMPNTPAAVGEGMIQYCLLDVSPESEEAFLEAMAQSGRLDAIEERLIDAATSVSGCGPAFAFLFMEALADAGVVCGLPRDKAKEYVAQMLLGSAKLALESGKHTGELKDAVCSPGGSTIKGIFALEENAFRGTVMKAVITSFEKTKDMGKV